MGFLPPISAGGRISTPAVNAAASRGIQVDSSSSAHTKGSWVTLVASTAHRCRGLIVNVPASAHSLLDIGIGAAASEKVVVANLRLDNFGGNGQVYPLPIEIPAGTRIAARPQASAAGVSGAYVGVTLLASGLWGGEAGTDCDTYGADTATTKGTVVDPGGSAHTKGSWAQLTSATTRHHKALIVAINGNNYVTATNVNCLVDIGIGAAAAEKALIPDIYLQRGTAAQDYVTHPPVFGPIPVNLPAGTRIAARCQSGATGGTRELDVIVYGI